MAVSYAVHSDDYDRIKHLLESLAEKDHRGPKCMELRLERFPKSAAGLRGLSDLATASEADIECQHAVSSYKWLFTCTFYIIVLLVANAVTKDFPRKAKLTNVTSAAAARLKKNLELGLLIKYEDETLCFRPGYSGEEYSGK